MYLTEFPLYLSRINNHLTNNEVLVRSVLNSETASVLLQINIRTIIQTIPPLLREVYKSKKRNFVYAEKEHNIVQKIRRLMTICGVLTIVMLQEHLRGALNVTRGTDTVTNKSAREMSTSVRNPPAQQPDLGMVLLLLVRRIKFVSNGY